jgi:hypothetical protein
MLMSILDFSMYSEHADEHTGFWFVYEHSHERTGFWFASEHAHEHTAYMPFKTVENLN